MDQLDAPDARRFEFEEVGDQLVGTVVSTGTYTGDFGTSPTYTIRAELANSIENAGNGDLTDEELVIVYASQKLLREKLEEQQVGVGDVVAIRYNGEKPTKDGRNTYGLWNVAKKPGVVAELDAQETAQKAGGDDW